MQIRLCENFFRDPRMHAEKALKEAVGLGVLMEDASFMITSRAANQVLSFVPI